MVPPSSDQVSRVWPYSGSCAAVTVFTYVTLTLFGGPSHALRLTFTVLKAVRTPKVFLPPVWPLPRSLATTYGISVDVSSSPYLDVSVQAVPRVRLFDSTHAAGVLLQRVSPFGNPRIDGYLLLPEAYRSLSRPSSAPDAKAFPLRSFQLDLLGANCASFASAVRLGLPSKAHLRYVAPPLKLETRFKFVLEQCCFAI